jgi:predicted amidohydrolase YtcJ
MPILRRLILVLAATAFGLGVFWLFRSRPAAESLSGRVLVARRILTMDTDLPVATAVAIEDGRIRAVGSSDELQRLVETEGFLRDERFRDKVLMPGFIDPHVHPTLAATILPMDIVSSVAWETPRGRSRPVRTREEFLARLRELDAARADDDWLLVWGYHHVYHGELSRADLDAVSLVRPIFVWQRSVHEMYFNRAALDRLGFTEAEFAAHPQASWEQGRIWEAGTFSLGRRMTQVLARPSSYLKGLEMMSRVLHRGGVTTVAEQGFPQVGTLAELATLHLELDKGDTPYRFILVPNAMFFYRREGSAAAALHAVERLLGWSTDRVRIVRQAKYYADGAIYSQLMQMSEPYRDGHHGEWLLEPEEQKELLDTLWSAGWDLHVHVNGDAALDVILDQVESAGLSLGPASSRRLVLEHYGYAREDQHERVAGLGIEVSNNSYYPFELAPAYARIGLGPERAADISPLGGLARAGVPFSFHSDFPMAPAEPLTLVWSAVNRVASDGQVWGEHQRVALELALRAITIEGARSLGMQEEIGSIRAGKRADFTVLERDPHETEARALADIGIWGTVFEGRVYPAEAFTPPP